MAYDPRTPPAMMAARVGDANVIWMYRTSDEIFLVGLPGYFSNGAALGMRPGDLIYVTRI